MNARLSLLLSLALASCTSTPARPAVPDRSPLAVYDYRAVVDTVPAGCSRLVLRVDLPTGGVRALRATGLVGNAPYDVSIAAEGPLELAPGPFALRSSWIEEGAGSVRRIEIETPGKPLELGLRLELVPGAGALMEADALARELEARTSLSIDGGDGGPAGAPQTRLARVR